MSSKKIVCLGGGIGTMNLVKGLHHYTSAITIIVSMADDGGSAGRLRRLYEVMPPGDVVSSVASSTSNPAFSKLLTYRFPGDRYGKDKDLGGQKVGNLLMVAAEQVAGSFQGGIDLLRDLFQVKSRIYPATTEAVTLSAKLVDGRVIAGEETIDLGKYPKPWSIDKIFLNPKEPNVSADALKALDAAEAIIAGPGDLYTNVLPVLIVPGVADFLKKTAKKKLFIINIANKPFETKGYVVTDFIHSVVRHLGVFPFDTVLVNNNMANELPYHYTYVQMDQAASDTMIISADVVDNSYPLYHDAQKVVREIKKYLK
ncbi:MAG: gluconeogenesis factor YvcK family protein [Patescibacteria group bacterium]